MELKKISLILLFVIFANYLKAEIIKPKKDFSAYEVVKIQLNALQKNDELKNDLGIKQVWIFAHPKNKKVTGPYEIFRVMIYGNQYKILLNHSSHKINLRMNNASKHIFKVEILSKKKQLFVYEWHVEKGNELNCSDCWFTSAVSIPLDQGNTI